MVLEQSKQYLSIHTVDNAHPADIYSLAVTPTQVLSASGASSLKAHSTTDSEFSIAQSLDNAHKIGCHHVVASAQGNVAASVGFAGEVKIWFFEDGIWREHPEVNGIFDGEDYVLTVYWVHLVDGKINDVWAITLSAEGQYLAGTTVDGRVKVWDLQNNAEQIRDLETKGLVEPVRTVAFSPGGKYIAAAGDSKIIVLYEVSSGEPAANFTGHAAWVTSLDWSSTGEYLLSGSLDGKVKVWSIERRLRGYAC
ncbi:superkiller [Ascosphaera atra]|nr:superkiller [Ascosphaera atra]